MPIDFALFFIGIILAFDLQILYDGVGNYNDDPQNAIRKMGIGFLILAGLIVTFATIWVLNL